MVDYSYLELTSGLGMALTEDTLEGSREDSISYITGAAPYLTS